MRGNHRLILFALTMGAAGCIQPFHSRSGIQADPTTIERQGEAVFTEYLIPVSERVSNNRVESGWFVANEVWSQDAIAQRVDCGFDAAGLPAAVGSKVQLSVTLRVDYRSLGTRLRITSEGHTVPTVESQDARRCGLSEPFVQELLTAVAGPFPGGTPGTDLPVGAGAGQSW
jgi:hypothetical protein